MARTVNGNLTGRDGADELREQRARLSDEYRKLRDDEVLARTVAEIANENDGIRRCVQLEGEASFYKWWDDDALVPPMGSRRVRIRMLEERIASLDPLVTEYGDIPPNGKAPFRGSEVEEAESNHDASVADEKTDCEKSKEEAED